MGMQRKDTLKIRKQCYGCAERNGTECKLGLRVMCRRQSSKSCEHYRNPSVIEAAKELARVAGIDFE